MGHKEFAVRSELKVHVTTSDYFSSYSRFFFFTLSRNDGNYV